MNTLCKIVSTQMHDLDLIFELFEHSVQYQESKGYPTWRNYDRHTIVKDIENRHQYKIVINSVPAIVFSIDFSDKIIWREMDNSNAIYLHRIVVNPEFKGRKLFGKILDWALEQAKQKKLSAVRMDTWADNPAIIDYYKKFGFTFVENYTTPNSKELPVHNRNLKLALLEYKLDVGRPKFTASSKTQNKIENLKSKIFANTP